MSTAPHVARMLRIRGTVQGVGFRWSMAQAATRLGVCGWVRNCTDGTVEALAVGSVQQVAALVEWAHAGPSGARVTEVVAHDVPVPDPLADGFDIARGA